MIQEWISACAEMTTFEDEGFGIVILDPIEYPRRLHWTPTFVGVTTVVIPAKAGIQCVL